MRMEQDDQMRLAEQAAEWAATLDGADARTQAAFIAWMRQSARHVEEFLLASALYRELDGVDAARKHDLVRLMEEGGRNVVSLKGPPGAPPDPRSGAGRKHSTAYAAAALLAGIVIAAALFLSPRRGWEEFATTVGEQRAVELADGSLLHLNTDSRVRVQLSKDAREIRLERGEALFKVARDPARPFIVHSDDTAIEAVGTQFNVYRQSDGTRLSVLEGQVRVVKTNEQDILAAGQEARIASDGRVVVLAAPDTAKSTAWRQRRLVFRDDALADVAAEFNRYNRAPRIRVEGAAALRRLTGVFDADAPESLLRFLREAEGLRVEQAGVDAVIRTAG